MDTDVEVLRPLDDLLVYEAVSGFETKTRIPTGLMACREGQPSLRNYSMSMTAYISSVLTVV